MKSDTMRICVFVKGKYVSMFQSKRCKAVCSAFPVTILICRGDFFDSETPKVMHNYAIFLPSESLVTAKHVEPVSGTDAFFRNQRGVAKNKVTGRYLPLKYTETLLLVTEINP